MGMRKIIPFFLLMLKPGCVTGEEYLEIYSKSECDKIAPYPNAQRMAHGLNAKTMEPSSYRLFDYSLEYANGSCKAFKTDGQISKFPKFFDNIFAEKKINSEVTSLYSSEQNTQTEDEKWVWGLGLSAEILLPTEIPVPLFLNFKIGGSVDTEEKLVYESTTYIDDYKLTITTARATLKRFEHIVLDKDFIKDVRALPATYTDQTDARYQKFKRFVDRHGHLYPVSLVLGGYFQTNIIMNECSMTSDSHKKIAVDIGADVKTVLANVSGDAGLSYAKKRLRELAIKRQYSVYSCEVRGGKCLLCPLNDLSRGLTKWSTTISASPVIIKGSFHPISDLIDHPEFDNISFRDDVKVNLRRFLIDDIESFYSKNKTSCSYRCYIDKKDNQCRCKCTTEISTEVNDGPGFGCCKAGSAFVTLSPLLLCIHCFLFCLITIRYCP